MNQPSATTPAALASAIAADLCPLCGQPNQCAMEQAHRTGQAPAQCWCTRITFSPDLLARVPERARNRACICQDCATKAPPLHLPAKP